MKRFKREWKRMAAIALAVLMVSNTIDMSVFAATASEVSCEHHTEHTADCGYVEAVEGSPCTHVHDETCGDDTVSGNEVCSHVHDEICGYAETVEGTPCSYVCESCADEENEEQPENETAECTCGTDDDSIHATNCAAYVALENPVCTCVEKCTEGNVWCDVCGFDYTQCGGTDTAVPYADCTCETKCTSDNVNSDCTVCSAEGTDLTACTCTDTTTDTTYPYAVVDTAAGTVTIDGTLGGKTTATEDDITALVEAIKSYVDSGITTIIVTGSQPAMITITGNSYTYTNTAIGEAIYRLSGLDVYDENNPYNGKIDLILRDVTEIVDQEFLNAWALNSITLPKVTKLGEQAFFGCYYLETITFGSVVTEGIENGAQVFNAVGVKTDAGDCGLVLNYGQHNAAAEYQPNLETNTWWDTGWKSISHAHTGGKATCTALAVCELCNSPYGEKATDNHTGTLSTYAPTADGSQHFATWDCCNKVETADHTAEPTYALNTDDSTKHNVTYSCCGTFTEVHSGGTATCLVGKICESCGFEYDETTNPDNHENKEEFTYTANTDGTTHTKKYKCCGATHSEAHEMDSSTGECVCGLPMADASLTTAGDTPVVTYYATFEEAITAAQSATGSTVQLLDSVTISNNIKITAGQFTIDLNGKTLTSTDYALRIQDGANVIITSTASDGKIEARMACVYVTTNGSAKVTNVALHSNNDCAAVARDTNAVLTLENVTITSGNTGVSAYYGGKVEILGTSSVKGDRADIDCHTDSTMTVGAGVTFPDGLTTFNGTNRKPLKDMLADGMAYWTGDNQMVQPDANTYEITGDVTVRAACTHSGGTMIDYTPTEDGTQHTAIWTCCNTTATEDHTPTYSASGNVITASCSECRAELGTATITATNATYNGNEHKTATVAYSSKWTGGTLPPTYENNINAGPATASISLMDGENKVTASVTFEIEKADAFITVENDKTSYVKNFTDDDFSLEGIAFTGEGTLTYTVADGRAADGTPKAAESILTVSEDGLVSIHGNGIANIYVGAHATQNYHAAKPQIISVEVGPVDKFFVEGETEYTYTGKAIKPELTVYDGLNGVLRKNKDYTITYKNNTNAYTIKEGEDGFDATKAPQAIIKGKGSYNAKMTVYFTIQPKNISDVADESIVVKEILLEENGNVQKKVPSITYNKKKLSGVLQPEDGSAPKKIKDFVYSYPELSDAGKAEKAFKEAGTWTIHVEGTGNYTGSRDVDVIIAAKGGKMTSAKIKSIPAQEYTGEAIDLDAEALKVTAKINGKTETLVRGTHYDVSYKNNTNIGTATVILTGIPEAGFSGSKTATFKITGTSLAKASVEGIEAKVYNGNAQTQNLTVTLSKKVKTENGTEIQTTTLVKDKDFTVIYDKNVNVGTAKLTIKGVGNYTGTIKKSFKITAYDMKGETDAAGNTKKDSLLTEANGLFGMKNGDLSVKYVKGGAKPSVKLMFNGRPLTEGKDYTVSYKNNKNVYTLTEGAEGYKAGKAPTLTIKGKGNFKGSVSKTFVITGRELQDADLGVTMTVNDKVVSNKKGGYISKPVLTDADGKVLKQGKDYSAPVYTVTDENGETITLTKNDKVEVGTVITVTVRGLGAYAGSTEDNSETTDDGDAGNTENDSVIVGTYCITANDFGKIKAKTIQKAYTGSQVTLTEDDFYYVDADGNKISKITIGSGKNKQYLEYGVDFEIVPGSYKNNVKKGTASVTLRGISDTANGGSGLYGGTKTIKFKIGTRGFGDWSWWRLW